MNMKIKTVLVITLALTGLCYSTTITDPFAYFNVYSLSDIGTSGDSYGSDFQGITGAGGDVYFSSFSLDGLDDVSSYVLHTAGNARLSGNYLGDLEVGGNLSLGSVSVTGNAYVGGNVSYFGGGTLYGDIVAEGLIDTSQQFTITGQTTSWTTVDYVAEHSSLNNYFLSTSQAIADMEDTTTAVNTYGKLTVTGSLGENVVTVDADELKNAWGFTINAPEDAVVFINVDDSTAVLDSTNWVYTGGITAGNVILNYSAAQSLDLSGSNEINILAPNASADFASGILTGSLITGDLTGAGQVNLGHFENADEVLTYNIPEPASLIMLAMGCCFICLNKKKQHCIAKVRS